MQIPGHGRDGDVAEGVFDEIPLGPPGCHLPQGNNAPGVVDPGSGPQQDRQVQLFGEVKGIDRHVFGFLGRGGLQHRQAGKPGVKTVVLLVLTGEQGGVVGRHNDHPAVYPGVSQGHQRVGGHIYAHVFHGHHGPQPGDGGPGGHFQRYLFIGGILEI